MGSSTIMLQVDIYLRPAQEMLGILFAKFFLGCILSLFICLFVCFHCTAAYNRLGKYIVKN